MGCSEKGFIQKTKIFLK